MTDYKHQMNIVNGDSKVFRAFSSTPTIKSGKGKVVFASSQLNKLLQGSLAVLDKIPDEELRTSLQADLRHEFEVFYSRKNLNLEAKDFLIDDNTEIHTNTVTLDNAGS